MKDLIIITDKPITYESCAFLIKKSFDSLLLCNDDKESIYMKKSNKGFELWFSPDDQLNNPEFFMGDSVKKCPNKNAYLTDLCVTSNSVALKIITLLKPLFGNMWIQVDEEDDWFGTAEEFINDYCNIKKA